MPNAEVLENKKALVDDLAEKIQNSTSAVYVDYKGVTVDEPQVAPYDGNEHKWVPTVAAADGTLLDSGDTDTVKKLQEQCPGYAANFPVWASQGNGMLQFALWTALTDLGLGVNIQHYNPIIDAAIKEAFEVPESWTLVAQMPFGEPTADPKPIEKLPGQERVWVRK